MPTPRKNRPGIRQATVAAAWATIAGWIRISGHVTPVPIRKLSVCCAIAPSTDHTKGLWPWASIQGWMWSEIRPKPSPDSSAARACRTRSAGEFSSDERAMPSSIGCPYLPCQPGKRTLVCFCRAARR